MIAAQIITLEYLPIILFFAAMIGALVWLHYDQINNPDAYYRPDDEDDPFP